MRLLISADGLAARLLTALSLVPLAACGSSDPTGTGGGASTSTQTSTPLPCKNPIPSGNLVTCEGGWEHRASAEACVQAPSTGAICMVEPDPFAPVSVCSTDADCTEKAYGRCSVTSDGNLDDPREFCGCSYGCATDADCGAGLICLCDTNGGYCENAGCKTDVDCGDGRLCASAQIGTSLCADRTYQCQRPADECMTDADCPDFVQCLFTGTHRSCHTESCGIGRPFLVEGRERLALLSARADWQSDGCAPAVDRLETKTRHALAVRWAEVGLMEHASVAAFARFVLQLLSLGAPPDLVRAAQVAMADETRHAEVCFTFASAYAGAPIGPGPLDINHALTSMDARTILTTAILEGCVGETVASLEAAETAERAQDPAVRAALRAIADEEARHAELAYRFVRWALLAMPELLPDARAAFAEALDDGPRVLPGAADDTAGDLDGFAGDALRREIRRQALSGVVAPTAAALLSAAGRAAAPAGFGAPLSA